MNRIAGGVAATVAIVILVVAYSSIFTVYQTRQAIVVFLGQPVRVISEPGLHFKWPFVESVISIDNRILDLENPSQEVIASDQKRLVVDAFARYKITGPLRFYQTVGSVEGANSRLSTLLNSALRRVLGENTLTNVVRDDRASLMSKVREQLEQEAKDFGIEIVDVRIRRADLPEQNSQAVYQRMQTERQREAAEFRAQGSQRAQEIRARADRDVTVLLADAQATADTTRGEGDGERNRIFADAFGRDPDFFSFYRAMQAYETGLRGDTRMLLKPDSDFFRYFIDPSGRARPGGTSTATGTHPSTPPGTPQGGTVGAQPENAPR
jgi:membrane protease subunit HflC